jgi:hypothetical protein
MAVVSSSLALTLTGLSLNAWARALIPAQRQRNQFPGSPKVGRIAKRSLALSFTLLAALADPPAFAQPAVPGAPQAVLPGANPETGARPGNVIGTGMSMPLGTRASNIDQSDTRSQIAPNLPTPIVGPNATPADYLRAAQQSLQAGRTGEAQQALEMAETRLLDRSVPMGQVNTPDQNPAIAEVSQALQALAAGDRAQATRLIQAAIPAAMASVR